MNFESLHPLLDKLKPLTTKINPSEFVTRKTKCEKCQKDYLKYGESYKFKVEIDIFFDVYYWCKSDSLYNKYAYSHSALELCFDYNCQSTEELLDKVKKIGIYDLVELGTYHSLWLHHFFHRIYELNEGKMHDWDDMYQSQHVEAKNKINFLIHLLLQDPIRKSLMQEIRDFSICPPIQPRAVSGYEYQILKAEWEKMAREAFNKY